MLLVSSPFPIVSSIPPGAIVMEVEDAFAFRSTLELAIGAVSEVPSPNGALGVPKLTASTTDPVASGPLRIAIELLFATVSLVFLSQLRLAFKVVLHHRK